MTILAPQPVPATASPERAELDLWVTSLTALLKPDRVVWCTGSAAERERLLGEMVDAGTIVPLSKRPGSYLARTDPSDVARVESRTFTCSEREEDAGPDSNWRDPVAMREELIRRFDGAMRGRTLYVVPFSLGPVGAPLSRIGVQLTDSAYAVVSIGTMTRMGSAVLDRIDSGAAWGPAVHSVGAPLEPGREDVAWPCNSEKLIVQFPETREIWSYGSGYGGNAILAKKCFALRIASVIGRDEGWLAEHMLLVRVISPEGKTYHIAGAFPSACGKTNFAMMQPTLPGWRVETIGDDIAWLRPGPDGRLWAINPEAGLFGVAPGTGETSNPVAMKAISKNTVFTNVAETDDGDIWWEGMGDTPESLTDWRGEAWSGEGKAAHPNGRFTVSMDECPTRAADWDTPTGVPIDAIVLGGRRSESVPLVSEALDWQHGVFLGATMSSSRTAAAEGTVGELVFDPFAMRPFTGYNAADHWSHWLRVGSHLGAGAPRIFRVNWFLKDEDGGFVWPGFGDNIRVVDWIVRRLENRVSAMRTPVGLLPRTGDLNLTGLDLNDTDARALLALDADGWYRELASIEQHLARYGDRVPEPVLRALRTTTRELWTYIS